MTQDFLFVTDIHIMTSCNVRTGNVLEDLCNKLRFVAQKSQELKAQTLIGGDVFDRPSVPDYVKSMLVDVFRSFYQPPICIPGNHSILWNSRDYDEKTTYNLFVKTGLIRDLSDSIDFGNVILTTGQTVETTGKLHLHMFHGFLNVSDQWAISFQDINSNDETYLLLGHDHIVYEPLQYSTTTIFRPGSLLRGIRTDESNRIPTILHITASDHLAYEDIQIPCRDYREIFKTKEFSIRESEKSQSYEDVIALMQVTNDKDLTMEQALAMVADQSVVDFSSKLLENYKLEHIK